MGGSCALNGGYLLMGYSFLSIGKSLSIGVSLHLKEKGNYFGFYCPKSHSSKPLRKLT